MGMLQKTKLANEEEGPVLFCFHLELENGFLQMPYGYF
jgi:hypothetical protein